MLGPDSRRGDASNRPCMGKMILNHARTVHEQICMMYGCGMMPPGFVIKIQDRDGGVTRRRLGERRLQIHHDQVFCQVVPRRHVSPVGSKPEGEGMSSGCVPSHVDALDVEETARAAGSSSEADSNRRGRHFSNFPPTCHRPWPWPLGKKTQMCLVQRCPLPSTDGASSHLDVARSSHKV
jgi:hypothetical protein